MSGIVTATKCHVMNGAAQRHAMPLVCGTRFAWILALALSSGVGLHGSVALAQDTRSKPSTESGKQATDNKCPVTGATVATLRHTEAIPGGGPDVWYLVRDPARG